jgi:WD40 repeat protein
MQASSNGKLLITCEDDINSKIIIWGVDDGKRLCTMQINQTTISSAAFNHDCSMLVTVGTDHYNRVQIVVWNISILLQHKSIALDQSSDMLHKNITDSGRAIAKQLSDFPISSISFSPFEDNCLVSCGRENIRFWRLRKKHLPGRPVLLGQFSRGFIFKDLSFFNGPGIDASDQRRPCVYVSSNKGIILKIDYLKENIICAYHLHQSSITSFTIHNGLAFTGSSDCTLRLWPMDFSDFVMEAQFEGSVTAIKIDVDGVNMLVGTSSGTIGVLKIHEHHYKTLLRSHTEAIHQLVKRNHGEEFASISADKTIRIWDLFTCQQKFEFSSVMDEPKSVDYHPLENVLVCGFESGHVRIFDVDSTSTLHELKHHKARVSLVKYVQIDSHGDPSAKSLRLITVSVDGIMVVYDASYDPLKSFSLPISKDFRLLRFAYLESGSIFAISTGVCSSLIVLNMIDYSFIVKDGQQFIDFPTSKTLDSPKSPSIGKWSKDLFVNPNDSVIKGLDFCCNGGFANLIVALDSQLTQIPIPRDSIDRTLCKANQSLPMLSSKKIDFGVIENFVLDPSIGMATVTFSSSSSSRDSKSKINFAVFQINSDKIERWSKIRVSSAQAYENHSGNVSCVIFCPQYGKVVSADDLGSIIVWNLASERMDKLVYFPSPEQEASLYDVDAGTRRVKINDTVDFYETNPLNVSALETVDKAKTMMNDFANVVSHDPSMWSAGTIDTSSPSSYRGGESFSEDAEESIPSPSYAVKPSHDMESVRLEDMFITDSGSYFSPKREELVHNLEDNDFPMVEKFDNGLYSPDTPRVDDDTPLNADQEEPVTVSNNDLFPTDAISPDQLESPVFSKHYNETFGLSDSREEYDYSFQFSSTINAVPPLYNAKYRELALSDGSMVSFATNQYLRLFSQRVYCLIRLLSKTSTRWLTPLCLEVEHRQQISASLDVFSIQNQGTSLSR